MRSEPPAPPPRRQAVIDLARAAALAAMAGYHALWDLGFLQLTPENYALAPAGRVAAHLIAGSFLVLVGIGLVLMNGRSLQVRPTLRRFARIALAAAAITAATWVAFPGSYIFFGVLHCIALSSLLGLPFLRLPVWLVALCAALVLAAPHLVHAPVLDAPGLQFLGLGRVVAFAKGECGQILAEDDLPRFDTLAQDIASLDEFETRMSETVQFLLDATLGLINIEQNNAFRVLTVVSVVGVPPTLVASIYGMNFKHMPELDWVYGYPYGLALVAISAVMPLIYFRVKGWL